MYSLDHCYTDPPHPRATAWTKERRCVDLYLYIYIKAVSMLNSVCMCVVERDSYVPYTTDFKNRLLFLFDISSAYSWRWFWNLKFDIIGLYFYLWAAQGQPGKRRQRHPGLGSEGGWKSLGWSPATHRTLEGTGTCAAPSHYRTLAYPPTAWTWEKEKKDTG